MLAWNGKGRKTGFTPASRLGQSWQPLLDKRKGVSKHKVLTDRIIQVTHANWSVIEGGFWLTWA